MQYAKQKLAMLAMGLCVSAGGALAQVEKTETENGIDRYR